MNLHLQSKSINIRSFHILLEMRVFFFFHYLFLTYLLLFYFILFFLPLLPLSLCLFSLGSVCWVTAPFHQDTLIFALRPRKLTTWQYRQSYGASSVTQVSFSMPPVTNTLFTIMSLQSRAFLDWLVVSLQVSQEVLNKFLICSGK